MCGIVGIAGPSPSPELVRRMAGTLVHRGPDGEGFASLDGCELGFRRLAIMDLAADSPPYANEDRSIWCVANAEIYNAPELRTELEARGHCFHTGVDTEILTHLYEEHGVDLVHELNGMFAFALWDGPRRRLLLARDRVGEKPLFYRSAGESLHFASELRALLCAPDLSPAVDPLAIRRYLLHDYFPAPRTPIAGIRKLPAGHLLKLENGRVDLRCYWDLADHFGSPGTTASGASLARELDATIGRAVERRRRSDVPIGVFLSGGLDSSTILAHLAEQVGPGVPAFSLGHADLNFDESRFARRTAEHFGAEFEELVLEESDLADGLRAVGDGFDEPLGDASIIPSYLLARHARRSVKVVLSGEGADELFAGYPTYLGNRAVGFYRRLPLRLRRRLLRSAAGLFPVTMSNVGPGYLLQRFADAAERDLVERHHTWFGSCPPDLLDRLLAPAIAERLADDDPFASARRKLGDHDLPDDLARLLYSDFTLYLQDDLLTKVDRATMLASLEARAPFLDHELAEFVAGLPSKAKLSGLKTKAILRRAERHRLPREVLSRRKRGFNIPFSRWLLHGLGDTLRRRFSRERVEARGLLSPSTIAGLLDEHLERRADHRKPLFTLLALDLWCDKIFGDGAAVPVAVERAAS